jgi:hypothetical protein
MYGYRAQPINYVLATVSIGAITANQGTANTAVNRWPVYLSDGALPIGTLSSPIYSRLSDGALPLGSQANPLYVAPELYNGPLGLHTQTPACLSRAAITLAGAGTTQIIALSGALQIRICHLSLGLSGATNITIVQGTGVNCVTGPADITGAYQNILGLALDFEGRSIVTAGAGQAVCITNSAAVTGGGFVTYTQY